MKGFKKEIDTVLKEAKNLIENKKYLKAISQLEKHKNYFKKNVDYLLLLAEAYEKIGNNEKAEEYFEQARFIEADIRSRQNLLKSQYFIEKKDYIEAKKLLEEAIDLNPFDPEPYVELHKLYKRQGIKKEALKILKILLTIDPFLEYPYVELGTYYYSTGNLDMAESVIEEGLKKIDTVSYLYESAKFFQLIGDFDRAEELMRKVCEKSPDDVDYKQKFVEILISSGKAEEALDVLLTSLEKFPDAPYLYQYVASIYDILGKDDLAEFYIRKAIANSESYLKEDSMRMLSEFLIERGKYDQAEQVLREIIDYAESSWLIMDAFLELAIIYMEQERFEDILQIAKEILREGLITEEEKMELLEIISDVLEADEKLIAAKKVCEYVLKNSTDEKQKKRCYTKLSRLREIVYLEKFWKKNQ